MSFAQETVLRDFVGGARAALDKANAKEVEPEKRTRKVGQYNVTDYVSTFDGHEVTQNYGDFTSDFGIKIPAANLEKMSEEDRQLFAHVQLFSEFVATGERTPALIVPKELEAATAKLLQKVGLSEEPGWSPYDNNKPTYGVLPTQAKDDGKPLTMFTFRWDHFQELGNKLTVGIARE